ncbi:MAG: DUF2953 domain-containing protein [Oscillospiraceae bacterium]|nr:DUF2953 domain-containing protein [Oscillospiraceae bacterium]
MKPLLIVLLAVAALIALIVVLILTLRVRFTLEYKDELMMRLFIGPVELKHVFDSDEEKAQRKGEEPPPSDPDAPKGVKKVMNIVKKILAVIEHLEKYITVKKLTVHCTVGSDDPMQTAILYGGGWAVMSNVVGILENKFDIKDRDCRMFCKYEEMDMEFYIHLDLSAPVRGLIAAGPPEFIKNKPAEGKDTKTENSEETQDTGADTQAAS